MSILNTIKLMGVEVQLEPPGNVTLSGLSRLAPEQADAAVEYARENKIRLLAELKRSEVLSVQPKMGFSIKSPVGTIPPMSEAMVAEGMTWPAETQRVWGEAREWFEARGYEFYEAGALAFYTVKELIHRHGSPLVLINELPPEVHETADLAREVFGDVGVKWVQEEKEQEVHQDGDVCCADCQHFEHDVVGDKAHALG